MTGKKRPKAPLDTHQQRGKLLLPPPLLIPGLKFTSWVDERMPDQLFAVLLLTHVGREFGLEILRRVAQASQGAYRQYRTDLDLTLTGLALMPEPVATPIRRIIGTAQGAEAALRPMLLFPDLPDRPAWLSHLGEDPGSDAWDNLAHGIAQVLHHQTETATDVRWSRAAFRVATGQLHLQNEEQYRLLTEYPAAGEATGFIRASEQTEHPTHDYSARRRWAASFWQQCLRGTACTNGVSVPTAPPQPGTSREQLAKVQEHLAAAFETVLEGGEEPRHVVGFGLTAYGVGIVAELLSLGVSQGILGRLGLRSLLEAYVTLKYLDATNDPALWQRYREYGQGQAKLAMLKLADAPDRAEFVSIELLRQVAGQDRAPLFVPINLGHWTNKDLRKLSEEAGVRDAYDRVYPWTSAFTHGNWAAVSAACTGVCMNPLHRLHAVLQPRVNTLDDVVGQASALADEMLETLARMHQVELPRLLLSSRPRA